MTKDDFLRQIDRLRSKWPKAFDPETIRVSGNHVASIPAPYLAKVVDNWISSRKPSDPPLPKDFLSVKESYGRTQEKKALTERKFSNNIGEILRTEYKVDSVLEAYELVKLKLKLGEEKA